MFIQNPQILRDLEIPIGNHYKIIKSGMRVLLDSLEIILDLGIEEDLECFGMTVHSMKK